MSVGESSHRHTDLAQSSLKKRFVLNFQDNVENCNSFTAQKRCEVGFPTIWEEGGTVVSW